METSGKSHAPNALPRYPMGPRDGLKVSQKKKITLAHSGIRTPDDTSVSLITIPTELSWLVREKIFVHNCGNKI
jgi:hypothetical protein